ncbi:metallophosphoesterase [Oleisolibacter albus]|uniref:metallophosphoesterase n=1 Tax=Oleisolibacter albus TaxID=2171757 RepID=UPI000DF3CA15|nr:metallophosphoesterase [Oleisolibacter albus]
MPVFFTADTHFGHAGAIGRFRRPFADGADMEAALVARWNGRVGPADEVWHLGDFALHHGPERMAAILASLNGRKHLLAGNNDSAATRALSGWADVRDYAELVVDDTRLVLGHYAFRTWNGLYKGAWNLHGHSHGQLKGLTRQVDVGVDVWDFRPVTLAEIKARFGRRLKPAD